MTAASPPRSWLYVPGDRPDRFAKAIGSHAQGVILDLEDAVVPDRKPGARSQVLEFLRTGDRGGTSVALRMNPLGSRHGIEDLQALLAANTELDALVLPKTEDAASLRILNQLLTESGMGCELIALIESARGVAQIVSIVESTERLTTLMFGAADYSADLGQPATGFRAAHARGSLTNAAAIRGLVTIDSPCFDVADNQSLAEECRFAHDLGFYGKAAIHPSQVETIELAFAPSKAELDRAHRLLELSDGGATLIDGKMIDIAILRWARRLVSTASPNSS